MNLKIAKKVRNVQSIQCTGMCMYSCAYMYVRFTCMYQYCIYCILIDCVLTV